MFCPFLSVNAKTECSRYCALCVDGNCSIRTIGQNILPGTETALAISQIKRGLDTVADLLRMVMVSLDEK